MRTKLTCVSGISALLSVAILTGCGDDEPSNPPDAGTPDATEAPDASDPPPDAGGSVFEPTKQTQVLSTGITMSYVEAGNTSGEAVIMLHGFTDTSRSFYPTIEALLASDTNLHIYALDQRGHGGSSMPDDAECPATPEDCFAMSDFADDVIAFMEAKSITTAHIVGHSMGSLVAQELALAEPDLVESLMLIGTLVFAEDNPAVNFFLTPQVEGQDETMGQWRGLLEAGDPEFQWPEDAYELTAVDADPDAMTWLSTFWVVDPTADQDFIAKVLPETTAIKLGTWIGALRGVTAFDTRTRLEELTVPTFVVWATQDAFMADDPDQMRVRAALDLAIEACNLDYYFYKTYGKQPLLDPTMVQTDLGHNTQWGAPDAIAADITAWVTNDEPTTDLAYTDPADVGTVLLDEGAAVIIEKQKAGTCP